MSAPDIDALIAEARGDVHRPEGARKIRYDLADALQAMAKERDVLLVAVREAYYIKERACEERDAAIARVAREEPNQAEIETVARAIHLSSYRWDERPTPPVFYKAARAAIHAIRGLGEKEGLAVTDSANDRASQDVSEPRLMKANTTVQYGSRHGMEHVFGGACDAGMPCVPVTPPVETQVATLVPSAVENRCLARRPVFVSLGWEVVRDPDGRFDYCMRERHDDDAHRWPK